MRWSKKNKKTCCNYRKYISLYWSWKRKVTEFEEDKIKIMDDFINENKDSFKSDKLVLADKLKK